MHYLIRVEHNKFRLFGHPKIDSLPFVDKHIIEMPNGREEGWTRTDNHFFAYTSIIKLKKWISSKDLSAIMKVGFKVYRLQVATCQKSKHQAMYLKEDIVKKTDISYMFESNNLTI